jgi:hypothetical protein
MSDRRSRMLRDCMLAGLLPLAGCAAEAPPAEGRPPPTGPFAVEGIGPATSFVYREEIEKDLGRRLEHACPNGFDVTDLATRRNTAQMAAQTIRYRAVVECRKPPQ